jgi:hypothetical protein
MIRVLFLGLVVLTAACGNKTNAGLCAQQVPPPAECNIACNPAPGSTNGCPDGYHCAANGKCDLLCTQVGHECGDGYSCTADGYCIKSGDEPDSGSGPDVNCPAIHFSATRVIPSIQLLVDRSTSMQENFNGVDPTPERDNGPYKYPVMRDALVGPQGVVTQLDGSVYFGATLFTAEEGIPCPELNSTPGRAKNNKDAIAGLLTTFIPPPSRAAAGFTPTPLAINAVVDDFMRNPPSTDSPPIILLATDGFPNECTTRADRTAESVEAAANAFAHGIKLYILAIAFEASGAAQHVQDMANAGQGVQPGQPNATAYSASNPTEMAMAFQTIIRSVQSCDLTLEHEINPAEAPSGTVTLNGTTLMHGRDWTVDANGLTLHLLGDACTTLKSSPNPVLDAGFPCGVVIF